MSDNTKGKTKSGGGKGEKQKTYVKPEIERKGNIKTAIVLT